MSGIGEIEKLLATADPPGLGPGPRAGVQPAAALMQTLDDLFGRTKLPLQKQRLIRALILLWHDHLDAAHVIAQDIQDADGAFVHGIVHRREPDYGNARYWFHRVGKHPAFPEIASGVSALLEAKHEARLCSKLIPQGQWDAMAFIDACSAGEDKGTLQKIQAIETRALLRMFWG